MIRIRLFDKSHILLTEIRPAIESVSWTLNNAGRARLFMPYSDPKCTLANLQHGNRILIEFDNGLPSFGGVIDTPRKQNADGVTVNAYTAEKLFSFRVTAKSRYFRATAPGSIYKGLITRTNAIRSSGIDIGNIYAGGTPRTLTYHYNDLWGRIKKLAALSGQDFDVTPTYDDGILKFHANWYDVKGADKSNKVHLVEGRNMADPSLNVQGNIANNVFLVGAGQTWSDQRYVAHSADTASEADYGYREYAEIQSNVKVADTLDRNAAEILAEKQNPREKFSLRVSDREPGPFGSFDVGDLVTLQAFSNHGEWAYDQVVRITGMQWNSNNTMRLEVEDEW